MLAFGPSTLSAGDDPTKEKLKEKAWLYQQLDADFEELLKGGS
jgi:hypothetical protein